MKLNIGCGGNPKPDAVNFDISPRASSDMIWDAENIPWPFRDNRVTEVWATSCLEHMHQDKIPAIMGEIWRVCCDGAKVHISVPTDSPLDRGNPYHLSHFNQQSFLFYTKDDLILSTWESVLMKFNLVSQTIVGSNLLVELEAVKK